MKVFYKDRKINKETYFFEAPLLPLFLIWIISCCILFFALGDLPLRDFDEGTVARVSYELSQRSGINKLLPTIWGEPYLNKPPGLHWLIANFINLSTDKNGTGQLPSEFVIRFVPALLSTFVVPIGGLIQWKLRPSDTTSCLTTSAILLTLMPIARHGRLAMLDGTLLTVMASFWLIIISIHNQKKNRFSLFLAGLISSFLLLLKAPLMIPIGISALIPTLLNTKKWSYSGFKWYCLGIIPGISWHVWHSFQRGAGALWLWWGDGIGRVLLETSSGSGQRFIVPFIEILEGGWPWLGLLPLGIYIAFQERTKISGQWYLSTAIIMALAIVPLKTQYPWYVHPLWVPFSLICGPALSSILKYRRPKSVQLILTKFFQSTLFIISVATTLFGILAFFGIAKGLESYTSIALSTGIFWLIGSILLLGNRLRIKKCAIISLITGNIIGLLILMGSNFWLWELNESWSVIPISKMINDSEAINIKMYGSYGRPSLNWYSSQLIKDFSNNKLVPKGWILLNNQNKVQNNKKLTSCKSVNEHIDWYLYYCGEQIKSFDSK